jgi:sulfopyruvate decarboxylase subunit beta
VPSSAESLRQALEWVLQREGPLLLRVPVSTVQPQTDFFLEDPVILAREFQAWLTD